MDTKVLKYKQANNLIESPYAQEFTAHEIKIFEIASALCTKDDLELVRSKNDKEFIFSTGKLAKLLNTSVSSISHEIENTASRIMKKTIHLRKKLDCGTIEFEMITIIPYARYKDGLFVFRLNYAILPYLLDFNEKLGFTEFQLNLLLELRSSYAIKLYKLLYQYRIIKNRIFSIEEIKKQFGLQNKYKQYTDFKKIVIIPAINQINKKTNMNVKFEEIKIGRSIENINFYIFINNNELENKINEEHVVINNKVNSTWNDFVELYKNVFTTADDLSKFNEKSREKICDYFLNANPSKFYALKLVNYVLSSNAQKIDPYLSKHGNGVEYISYEDACRLELEYEKIIKKNKEKNQTEINKVEQKKNEAEIVNRTKHEFYKLSEEKQAMYEKRALKVLKDYEVKMKKFNFENINEILPIFIFAIENNTIYNQSLKLYLQHLEVDILRI